MSFEPADGAGGLRRERLRTARLYFVCDAAPNGNDPEPLLKAALDGGVDIVQLREKEADTRVIERAADTFRRVCDTYGVPFILNDDPELAMSVRADGVHIGQDDISPAEAREKWGRTTPFEQYQQLVAKRALGQGPKPYEHNHSDALLEFEAHAG